MAEPLPPPPAPPPLPQARAGVDGPMQLAARAGRHQGAADGLAHAAAALRAACASYQETAKASPAHRPTVAVLVAVLEPMAASLADAAAGEQAKAHEVGEQVARITRTRRTAMSRSVF